MRVHLTYFKGSGKYYSSTQYTSTLKGEAVYKYWEEVEGTLPGLYSGAGTGFTIHIDIPDHPNNNPRLIT